MWVSLKVDKDTKMGIVTEVKQELKNLPPFFGMRMTRVLPPCVETGHTEFENHAHHLNLKLVRMTHSEIETFRSLKEKMKMASFLDVLFHFCVTKLLS